MRSSDQCEAEFDNHIRDCGARMEAALKLGDRVGTVEWQRRMFDAIRARSPKHQASLTARIEAALGGEGQ